MDTTTTTRLLDGGTVDRFRRDGFVVVDGLLDQDELDRYGAAVTAGVHARTAAGVRPYAERSRYQQSFLQCMNLWEDRPHVRPLTFHPRLGQAAAELLGVDAIRLWHDQALYKEPGGRGTDAHQDHPYWPIKETASVTAWIPFDGSRRSAGAMAHPHFAVDRGGIAVGQPIASDTTPIVWPRPPGDLPPVPTAPIMVPGGFANPGAIPDVP
jgi:ectoine hydroxylase-related dioxygenase (phytanoyl-CoA dioxygenase family)